MCYCSCCCAYKWFFIATLWVDLHMKAFYLILVSATTAPSRLRSLRCDEGAGWHLSSDVGDCLSSTWLLVKRVFLSKWGNLRGDRQVYSSGGNGALTRGNRRLLEVVRQCSGCGIAQLLRRRLESYKGRYQALEGRASRNSSFQEGVLNLHGSHGRFTSIGIRSALAQLVNVSSGPAWLLVTRHQMYSRIDEEATWLTMFFTNLKREERE